MNIIYETPVESGNPAEPSAYSPASAGSYYYDENTNKILTQEEYLKKLGTTEEHILQKFNEEYGDKYSNRTYDFSHIIFWYDDNNELQFSSYNIDMMDSNTADFNLIINRESYKTGEVAPDKSPFGETVDHEEKYTDEVWAGSWWIEEYYDGAFVLFAWNKESGLTYPFRVEITKPDKDAGFTVRTFREAAIGDTKDRILQLYPEIDPQEQEMLNDTEDLFRLSGNGYLYLEFHFEKDVVTKIAAGAIID